MVPNVPQTEPLHRGELATSGVRTSLASSSVTAIVSVVAVASPAVTVGVTGVMLTTGPVAAVMVKVSEAETPFTVTFTVTEFGDGGTGGAMYVAESLPVITIVPPPETDTVAPALWPCSMSAVNT
jgi:hypothetical protein